MLTNVEKTVDEICEWIREFFENNGKTCSAVLGISGGKDSCITAALLARALGRERVVGVMMPDGVQPDISDSQAVVDYLGIRNYTVNIGEAVKALKKSIEEAGGTITKDVGIMPPSLQPLASTLIEDDMNIETRRTLSRLIHAPESVHGKLCVGGGDLTIADFRNTLSLPDMEWVNGAAKRAGRTIIVVSRLSDAQNRPYENMFSYGELAMRISVEQGIDLTECAESIISLRERDYGRWRNYMPASILCRPLKIWKDDTCSDEFVIRCDENGRLNIVACNTTR